MVQVNRKRFGTESNLITGWVRRATVDLVYLVHLVCLVQPNKPDKLNKPNNWEARVAYRTGAWMERRSQSATPWRPI